MPILKSIAPQFLIDDLDRSISYYTSKLGFEERISYGDSYASVARDNAEIHLKVASKLPAERELRRSGEHIDAYIWVQDFTALFGTFQTNGASILYPPKTQPWGVTDFYVQDPDGYILCFGQDGPG